MKTGSCVINLLCSLDEVTRRVNESKLVGMLSGIQRGIWLNEPSPISNKVRIINYLEAWTPVGGDLT